MEGAPGAEPPLGREGKGSKGDPPSTIPTAVWGSVLTSAEGGEHGLLPIGGLRIGFPAAAGYPHSPRAPRKEDGTRSPWPTRSAQAPRFLGHGAHPAGTVPQGKVSAQPAHRVSALCTPPARYSRGPPCSGLRISN